MQSHEGAWVGWHGAPDEELEPFESDGMELVPVPLSASEDVELYYEGFSNATLWPLYHDVIAHPEFHRDWWDAYVRVNQRFAERTAEVAEEGALVWVQDYQLQLVPQMLRELRPDLRIGFFLHIPFPPTELYQQLPWRNQILEGLLGADLVGFQLPGRRAELPPPGPPAPALETRRERIHDAGRSHGHRAGLSRSPSTRPRWTSWRSARDQGTGRARSAPTSATRRRSCSVSTASTTPRACRSGSRRSAS